MSSPRPSARASSDFCTEHAGGRPNEGRRRRASELSVHSLVPARSRVMATRAWGRSCKYSTLVLGECGRVCGPRAVTHDRSHTSFSSSRVGLDFFPRQTIAAYLRWHLRPPSRCCSPPGAVVQRPNQKFARTFTMGCLYSWSYPTTSRSLLTLSSSSQCRPMTLALRRLSSFV